MKLLITDIEDLGMQLRAIRKAKGLTQAEVMKRSKFSRTHIVQLEAGGSFSPYSIIALCKALGVKPMLALELTDEDFKLLLDNE